MAKFGWCPSPATLECAYGACYDSAACYSASVAELSWGAEAGKKDVKLTRMTTTSERAGKSQRGKALLAALTGGDAPAIGMNAAMAVRARMHGPAAAGSKRAAAATGAKSVAFRHLLK